YATQAQGAAATYNETRHGIGYLVNELLENAVKFRVHGEIRIESSLDGSNFEIRVVNYIDETTSKRFRALLEEIMRRDAGELLIERIEANAANPSSSGSGLGLLTLMSDYGARLGWIFQPGPAGSPTRLETFAALSLS
ncbi:MAG: ATP-binding protein, partial [Rhizobiaceae bacterium]|nr:ATP-binding protein [Rhizobiaceae bacterium]